MQATIERWLARDPDAETRAELQALVKAEDHEEIQRRFAGRLAFGTAGLRAVVGAGPCRMNRLVVRETTAGLAAYLASTLDGAKSCGVVVGYDGRTHSALFAHDVASVLAGAGFRVHLADRPVPTPICAYALRELGAAAAIVVTASHNPPEYNGYKVYWENGAQIIPPHDASIAQAIEVAATEEIPFEPLEQALASEQVTHFGADLWQRYLDGVAALSVHTNEGNRADFVLAYTPLHGVGAEATERALKRAGFTQVHTAASQREPDGRFPTVRFPNPEEPGAMDAVLELAHEHGAELAIANDPDADRLAIAARHGDDYRMLSGDQIGVLLGLDRLESLPASEQASALVATTVVSSRLLGRAATARGSRYLETLTGFKWIINSALDLEHAGAHFVFGYEEALGYCVGSLVRDKDGISAAVVFAELAAALAHQGLTVFDRLATLYRTHGVHLTQQKSLALSPHRDPKTPTLGDALRATPPSHIAGRVVERARDLNAGEGDLAPSDVLIYELAGDARVVVRPSGTEPKLKCYYEICEKMSTGEDLPTAERRAKVTLRILVEGHQAELAALEGTT
ncbi:MAG: phospho-sugar mutase [Deltaproteobacteria bacterium]|nr:phospho-sugar mutase [Deltaproteobacteria bacterium]